MSEVGHDVRTGGDGRPVFVKTAAGEAGRRRLLAEARHLATLSALAVVEVVTEPDPDADVTELVLRWVGAHSLATAPGLRIDAVADVVARVADIVDGIHTIGLAHGRLTADHVLLGPDGAPVLTGLAEATEATTDRRRADVVAVATLLTELLLPLSTGDLFARRPDDARRNALLGVADRAVGDELVDPLAMPELARGIRATAPPSRGRRAQLSPPQPAAPDQGTGTGRLGPRSAPRGRWGPRAAVGTAAVVVMAGLGLLVAERGTTPPAAPASSAAASPTPSTPPVSAPRATPAGREPAGREPSTPPTSTDPCGGPEETTSPPAEDAALDVDGDGCPDDVEVRGHLVRVGDEVRAVGEEGDALAVGDWDCDGRSTVVALRPATGEVFHFARWSRAERPVAVEAMAIVPGATDLDARATARPGCHELVVRRPRHSPATQTLEVR